MPKAKPHTSSSFIVPLYMNKLRGRLLYLPTTKKRKTRQILIIYGQKSTIEQWRPMAEALTNYGNVTMPDLPGFGGMDSFYKIHEKPSLDNMADYLAAFIKLKYRRGRITIVGLSYGFVIVTYMLQKYPELVKKVELLFNVSGITHHSDINANKFRKLRSKTSTRLFTRNLPSYLYKLAGLEPHVFNAIYRNTYQTKKMYKNTDPKRVKELLKLDIKQRYKNDVRTFMYSLHELLNLDNTHSKIDLPVYYVNGIHDELLNQEKLVSHLEDIYTQVYKIRLLKAKPDSIYIDNAEEVTKIIPTKLKKILNSKPIANP
jgi:pimeloyl-ACP methyl ester carboxylesterase